MLTAKEKYGIMNSEHCCHNGVDNCTWVWDVYKDATGKVRAGCYGLNGDHSGKCLFDPDTAWALCSLAGWSTRPSRDDDYVEHDAYLVMQSEGRGWAVATKSQDPNGEFIDLLPERNDAET